MSIRVDNHSHILDAEIVDMVASAKEKSITECSITEHVSQFKELRESVRFGSTHLTGRIFRSLREYNDEFRKVAADASKLKINRGLEVDYSPRFETRVGEFVNQQEWDILLCSVHEFGDNLDVERRHHDLGSTEDRWREYFALEHMALESDFVPFNVLAHPVRISRAIKSVPNEIASSLFDLASVAKRRGKALELNGNDIDSSPQLVRLLAVACSRVGCRVSLGSDAHRPKDVFRNMQIAIGLVDEFKLQLL